MLEELLSKLGRNEVMPLIISVVAILSGVIIAMTAIIAGIFRQHRQQQLSVTLMHDLLERGLPTEEIERLLLASGLGDADVAKKMKKRMLREHREER